MAEWLNCYSHDRDDCPMNTTTSYRDSWINPRFKIAAGWASMMFVFTLVDLFGMYRPDVRADIEAGTMSVFTIGQGYLLGVTLYVALPAVMLLLTLVLPVELTRWANIAVALLYGLTIVGSAVGEWTYFIVGSAIEAALLGAIVYYAWSWPKALMDEATVARQDQVSHLV